MAGTGYNIPISFSVADSFSAPQTTAAPTYFNFGANSKQGGDITANPLSYAPATAVATAAEGNASSTNQQGQPSISDLTKWISGNKSPLLIGVAIVAVIGIGVAVYYYKYT